MAILNFIFRAFARRRARKAFASLLASKPIPTLQDVHTSVGEEHLIELSDFAMAHIERLLAEKPSDDDLGRIVKFGTDMKLDRSTLESRSRQVARDRDKDSFRTWMERNVGSLVEPGDDSDRREVLSALRVAETALVPEDGAEIKLAAISAYLYRIIEDILEDRLVTPEEDTRLEKALSQAKDLGIDTSFDSSFRDALTRARENWTISHGPMENISTLDVRIPMVRGESCYRALECTRSERRSVTKRIRYAGPTARIKIAKGIYLRAGDLAVAPVREEHIVHQDTGTLYLTNRKLLFSGQQKGTRIMLNKVVSFEPYSDGLEVFKETGRNQIFQGSFDDHFFTLLNRFLSEM